MLSHCVYINDADDQEILNWLCETISGLVFTTRPEFSLNDMHHGDNDLWLLHSQDVSDVSLEYDIITCVQFTKLEDAMLCKLRFGGTLQ